ncbi:nucleotide disphospho-sugar-binding domain-containing protein [Streptomyces sp. NPDC013178]|uniref:nucleotide disphospho-sugar-binding domain-containing protein n=1 Tax=Streptomyces sp. NPDC013178 TaxID=3155118 RepID=UPI0033D6DFF9
MRVLFATWAAPGHLFPMVPLAWACRTAGAEVAVAAPPHCLPLVHRAGLPAVAMGPDAPPERKGPVRNARSWGSDTPWPDGWTARPELLDDRQTMVLDYTASKQVSAAGTMVDDLVAFARWWRPDLVVCDALCFAGPVAAAAVDVPHLAMGWELAPLLRAERAGRGESWLPGYAELFERFGAEPRGCSDHVIDVSPPSLRIPESFPGETRRTPMRYVPYNGSAVLPAWLTERPRRPRVCVTSGVALDAYDADTAARVTRRITESVGGLGFDVVVATGPGRGRELGDLPPGTRVAEGIPFHALLPTCAAVVHHGGAGTALTAVASGTPQLILPQSPFYADIGHRVRTAGTGMVLDPDSDPEQVGAALAGLLEDERYAKALAEVRAEMTAMPVPARVARELGELTRPRRSEEGAP